MDNDEVAAAARATEQARLRKERREAKIKSGGASRLNRITGLGGGLQRDAEPAAPAEGTPPTAPSSSPPPPQQQQPQQPQQPQNPQHPDPDEVDISQHYFVPSSTARPTASPFASPFGAQSAAGPDAEDPMMRMMMQMMGPGLGQGGGGGDGSGSGANPFANLGALFPPPPQDGGPQPGFPNLSPQLATQSSRYATLWRLLHIAVALGLGLYMVLFTSFSGTRLDRERGRNAAASASVGEDGGGDDDAARRFFWAFATAEAVLLTTRFFLDRRRSGGSGGGGGGGGGGGSVLAGLAGFLPAQVRGPVEMVMRYGTVLRTVRADVSLCVFVLGVAAWLRSTS